MSPRTKQQNEEIRQQTRQQIIDAAFELFGNDGFSKTSIAAVAKKAGVSKGLIYHYFDSKEAILEAIFNQLIELADETLDFPAGFTPANKIKYLLDKMFEFMEKQTANGRLMISLALQPEAFSSLKPRLDEVKKNQLKGYISMFEELGYSQPELEAYQLGAVLDGILLGFVSMGDDYPYKQLKQKIMGEYVPH